MVSAPAAVAVPTSATRTPVALKLATGKNPLRASLTRDSVKDAVAHAVELSGRPRREIYARALELAKQAKGDHGED